MYINLDYCYQGWPMIYLLKFLILGLLVVFRYILYIIFNNYSMNTGWI